jgi:hypothetical protein
MVTMIDRRIAADESKVAQFKDVQFSLNSDRQFIIKLFEKNVKNKDIIISFDEEETKKMLNFIHEDLSW